MADDLTRDDIEVLERALLATLAPITGARATGSVDVTAGAVAVSIPANAYLLPVVSGQLRDDLLFKSTEGLDLEPGDTAPLAITSNVGGSRHNLPSGTVFRFDPPVFLPHAPSFEPAALLAADMTDGSDVGAWLKAVAVFEDVEELDPSGDMFSAKIGDSPAAIISWIESEPVDGSSAGLRTSSTRVARGKKAYRESFALYVRAGHLGSDHFRRRQGKVITQAITRLLNDRMQNDDGEQLSAIGGGVEVTSRAKLGRGPTGYLYGLRLRTNVMFERVDTRAYSRWTASRMVGSLPDPSGATEPLDVVDDTVDMP
jgi:hypothetical protein